MAAWNFKFPTSVEEITWKAAVLVSIGLPILFITINAMKLLLLLRAVNSMKIVLWPGTIPEAKVFLTNLVKDLSKIQYSHIREPSILASIKVAIEQGGPSSAYLGINRLQGLWFKVWCFLSRDIDPLLLWYTQYFLSKIDEGYFNQWLHSQHDETGQPFDLPQIISEMPVPIISRSEELSLRRKIVRFKEKNAKGFWKLKISLAFNYVSMLLYLIARLGIIAVAFSCFRAMPESVYVATWTKYIPSVE